MVVSKQHVMPELPSSGEGLLGEEVLRDEKRLTWEGEGSDG